MILSDRTIKDMVAPFNGVPKKMTIEPFNESQLSAASYDFRLGRQFARYGLEKGYTALGLQLADTCVHVKEWEASSVILFPGDFLLARSEEYFEFPDDVAGKVMAKSSIGRLGIAVSNGDACWFDPGFKGHAVLELKHNGCAPIILSAGTKVGQMVFMYVDRQAAKAYDGNYQVQTDLAIEKWKKALVKLQADAVEHNYREAARVES